MNVCDAKAKQEGSESEDCLRFCPATAPRTRRILAGFIRSSNRIPS